MEPMPERPMHVFVDAEYNQYEIEAETLAGELTEINNRVVLPIEGIRDKLRVLILRALIRPTPRRPTRPTLASKQRRVADKRQRSTTKQLRRRDADD